MLSGVGSKHRVLLACAVICSMGPFWARIVSETIRISAVLTTDPYAEHVSTVFAQKIRIALISSVCGNVLGLAGVVLAAFWWWRRRVSIDILTTHDHNHSPTRDCTLAILSLLSSCLSLLVWPLFALGIACGHIARVQCPGKRRVARRIAFAGLTLGYICLLSILSQAMLPQIMPNKEQRARTLESVCRSKAEKVPAVFAAKDLPAGTVLKREHLIIKAVSLGQLGGSYVEASDIEKLLGKKLVFLVRAQKPLSYDYVMDFIGVTHER